MKSKFLFSSAELHISEQNDIAERSGGREARHIVDTPCWQHSQNTIAFPPYSHTRAITKFFRHKQPWTHFQVFLSHNSASLQIHSLYLHTKPISKFFRHKHIWTHFQVFLSHVKWDQHYFLTQILEPIPSFFVTNKSEPITKFFCHKCKIGLNWNSASSFRPTHIQSLIPSFFVTNKPEPTSKFFCHKCKIALKWNSATSFKLSSYSHTRPISKFFRHKHIWTHFQVFLSQM